MKKIFVGLILSLILIFFLLINIRPRPEALDKYLYPVEENAVAPGLIVQFLGNTNILLSDGETHILTDAFFSRPSAWKVLFGKVSPNKKRIQSALDQAGIKKLDAIIPVHSHFDHAMDAPMVADMTQAQLLGSSSTMEIAKGYGLNKNQMKIPPLNQAIPIGDFQITFIKSRHWQYPDAKQRALLLDQDIEAPIQTPASIYDYKEGISYTLLIQHENTNIAIQGSAGFKENSIKNFDADILFFAIAGLEVMDDTYNQNYQQHVIDATNPEVIIPIHWDDFTVPLHRGLKTTHSLFNLKFGSDLSQAFEIVEKNNLSKNRRITVLPLWDKIEVNELLK